MAEEFGGRKALDEALDRTITTSQAKARKGGKPVKRSVGIDKRAAERMASDLDDYDSRIKAGRLTGGGGS